MALGHMIYQNLPVILEFVDLILERTDALGPSFPKVVAIIQFTQSEEKSKGFCLNCGCVGLSQVKSHQTYNILSLVGEG